VFLFSVNVIFVIKPYASDCIHSGPFGCFPTG
jgi:hypothetical protein